jgi:hypothetical protein
MATQLPPDGTNMTSQEVAEYLVIDHSKVLIHIRKRKLKATNVSTGLTRPRYRIRSEWVREFEEVNAVPPISVRVRRKRRKLPKVIEYF